MNRVISLGGASLLVLGATPSLAQQPFGQDVSAAETIPSDGASEEIIVTARRRDETIQDVPAVVNAVTAEDIAKLNFRDFTEVKNLVPGLQLLNNANGIGGNAQLRGVNFDINASGNNPTVEFYMNDAPITAGVVLQQIYDIGQIEVVRGPQGTLRGRASPSGSITVTTRKPDLGSIGGYVDLTANDIGTQNINGALNIPVIEGIAAIRVAGVVNEDNAGRIRSIDPSVDGRDPHSRTYSGRISALIEPAEWLRVEGVYQRIDRSFRQFDQVESENVANPAAAPSAVFIGPKDRRSNASRPNYARQIFNIYNGRADLSFAGQKLIYQFQHYTQDIDGSGPQDPANFFSTTSVIQRAVTHPHSTSHELRLQNQERVLNVFDYVVGAFDYINSSPTQLNSPTVIRLPLAFGGGVALVNQTTIARNARTHERSFFGNLTAHIGDATEASGGVRFIHYKDRGQLLINGALLADDAQNDHEVIYTASLKHEFTPDLTVYANTGTSYRPGITAVGDFNIAPTALERSFLTLPAETSQSYEVGLKSSLFDRRIRLNVTGYYQKFKNFPYRTPTGVFYVNTVPVRNPVTQAVVGVAQQVGSFNFVSAVPVEVKGIEAEISGNITPRWSLSLVASYSDGKIKGGTIPCNDLNRDGVPDSSGATPSLAALQLATGTDGLSACKVTQRSAFLPPFTATVQSEYSVPLSGRIDGYLRGLFNLAGASQSDPSNAFDDVERYGLLNLFVGVRDRSGMWELTAYAKNITDEVKVLTRGNPLSTPYQQLPGVIIGGVPTITGAPSGASATSSYVGITTTPQREFGVNFKFRFGSR